jgi:hypothetical protein
MDGKPAAPNIANELAKEGNRGCGTHADGLDPHGTLADRFRVRYRQARRLYECVWHPPRDPAHTFLVFGSSFVVCGHFWAARRRRSVRTYPERLSRPVSPMIPCGRSPGRWHHAHADRGVRFDRDLMVTQLAPLWRGESRRWAASRKARARWLVSMLEPLT